MKNSNLEEKIRRIIVENQGIDTPLVADYVTEKLLSLFSFHDQKLTSQPHEDNLGEKIREIIESTYQIGYGDGKNNIAYSPRLIEFKTTQLLAFLSSHDQELIERIEEMKKSKILQQALEFEDKCFYCGVTLFSRRWINDKCKEIRDETLNDIKRMMGKENYD